MKKIFTIGYAAYGINEFVNILKSKGINCVIDVRSVPMSRYFPDYNKESIEKVLRNNGILYRNYDAAFGARQTEGQYYSDEGYLDFEKYIESKQFNDGVNKILAGMEKGYVFALMCAEKDPINCHRSIMIGRQFAIRNVSVCHILNKEKVEDQKELEKRLLDIYYPDRYQVSLLSTMEDDKDLILKAYKKRNAEIGFKINAS